ncbi:MAG: TolC family protein [Ignavibacteriaceae bacterium]|nr:TolC family protein [Ignavibacteriaceae bacterium]
MRFFKLIIFFTLMPILLTAQSLLTMDEAIKIALSKNTDVNKGANSIESAKSNLNAANGNLLPNISASAGWSWTRSDDEGSERNIGGTIISVPASKTESRGYSASVRSDLNLFDGLASWKNINIKEYDLESSSLTLKRIRQNVAFRTIQYYYSVANAIEQVKVREENLKWNQKNLEIISERNKLGAVTMADVLQQQVRVGQAELDLLKAKNSLETAKSDLLYYLGLEVTENYAFENPSKDLVNVVKTIDDYDIKTDDLNTIINQAMKQRLDYKSAKYDLMSAEENISIQSAGHMPSLNNSISYNLNGNEIGKLFDSRTLNVALSLSIPIFSGYSVTNRVQIAEIQKKNVEIDIRDLERQIRKELQKTVLDLELSIKQVEVSVRNVKAAEENRKIEEEKYTLGATTLLNVLIANSDYLDALTTYINSKFQYTVLKQQLEFYIGTIDRGALN